MGDVIRLPGVTDFPFMPAQNVNMGSVLGHLKNFIEVYRGQPPLMWAHFEQELKEHISGFGGLEREPGKRGSTILTIMAKGPLGKFQYSVKLYSRFFKV
jgi:hypothetical protein